MAERIYNVLFLCTANSARSVLGEAILNRRGSGRFKAFSAGSRPRGQVNPHTLKLLEALGYDTEFARSKSWDEFEGPDAPVMDFIFTVCDDAANEVCPIWPGHPMTAHWGIPDPARAEGGEVLIDRAFMEAYKMLERRISVFVNLPHESIDRLALKARLDQIGKTPRQGGAGSQPDVA